MTLKVHRSAWRKNGSAEFSASYIWWGSHTALLKLPNLDPSSDFIIKRERKTSRFILSLDSLDSRIKQPTQVYSHERGASHAEDVYCMRLMVKKEKKGSKKKGCLRKKAVS